MQTYCKKWEARKISCSFSKHKRILDTLPHVKLAKKIISLYNSSHDIWMGQIYFHARYILIYNDKSYSIVIITWSLIWAVYMIWYICFLTFIVLNWWPQINSITVRKQHCSCRYKLVSRFCHRIKFCHCYFKQSA